MKLFRFKSILAYLLFTFSSSISFAEVYSTVMRYGLVVGTDACWKIEYALHESHGTSIVTDDTLLGTYSTLVGTECAGVDANRWISVDSILDCDHAHNPKVPSEPFLIQVDTCGVMHVPSHVEWISYKEYLKSRKEKEAWQNQWAEAQGVIYPSKPETKPIKIKWKK